MAHYIGEYVRFSIKIKDEDGNLTDPATSIRIRVEYPDGGEIGSGAGGLA